MESIDGKALRYHLSWFKEILDTDQKIYTETLISLKCEVEELKEENASLKAQVKEITKREEELIDSSQTNEKALKTTIKTLEFQSQQNEDRITLDLKTQLNKCTRESKKTVKELSEQLQLVTKERNRAQRKCNQLEGNLTKLLKEQEDKAKNDFAKMKSHYETEMKTLKKVLHKTVVDDEFEVLTLKADIQKREDTIGQQNSEKSAFRAENRSRCRQLDGKINKLNEVLEGRNKEILLMTKRLDESKVTIQNLNTQIKTKASENLLVTRERREVQSHIMNERAKNDSLICQIAEMKGRITTLENEIEDHLKKEEKMSDDLIALQIKHRDQTEVFDYVSRALKSKEPEIIKLKENISLMETHQLRLKENLQDCVDVVNYPNALQKAILKLRDMYLTDEIKKPSDYARIMQENKIGALTKQLEYHEKIFKAQRDQIQQMETQIDSVKLDRDTKLRRIIDRLNEECRMNCQLVKQLNAQGEQLRKASIPMRQKISSWVNKKILHKAKPPPDIAEEVLREVRVEDYLELPTDVLPTDFEPIDFEPTDFEPTDVEPMLGLPSNSPTSALPSNQPQPHSNVTWMKPRTDDGMPPPDC